MIFTEDSSQDPVDILQDSLPFILPSIDRVSLLSGESYSYYSPKPVSITNQNASTSPSSQASQPYVLGVDEAGRGPVLGPMVYSAFYLPSHLHRSLLTHEYSFNDSKTLTPGVRSNLMRLLCTPGNSLFKSCGWAVKVLSARDISSGMMRPGTGIYNLNAQAMDATIEIIRGIVEDRKVDVREVYIDTVGNPTTYQQKLERIFPSLKITVAKKADSLYPCVSAASVVAKVTRDAGLEVCYEKFLGSQRDTDQQSSQNLRTTEGWGSGYPSDSKCVGWLQRSMNPIFGWHNVCRFSWGTAKEMLELKGGTTVDWPAYEENNASLTDFLCTQGPEKNASDDGLREWYGHKATEIL